jgi:hypothetical protein
MSNGHSYLAPSSAHVRRQCAAAAQLMAAYPKPDTDESREGTVAHWVALMMLNGGEMVERPHPEIEVTDEMREAAEVYYSDVIAIVPDLQGLHLEERVSIPTLTGESCGTPDAWHMGHPGGVWTLTVWDYKYGHRYVPAFENWQLIEYVAGILDFQQVTGAHDEYLIVDMRVIQPRCFVGGSSVRSWRVRASDLRGYINEARNFEERAMLGGLATTGPECRDCVSGACSAAGAAAYNAIDVTMEPQPFDLSPEALGLELRKLRRAKEALEARFVPLEQQAIALIKSGKRVPWNALEQGQARAVWTVPADEVAALGGLLGIETMQTKPLTPNQVIKNGAPADLVTGMSRRPVGELKLKPDDGSAARKVFSAIDGGGQ